MVRMLLGLISWLVLVSYCMLLVLVSWLGLVVTITLFFYTIINRSMGIGVSIFLHNQNFRVSSYCNHHPFQQPHDGTGSKTSSVFGWLGLGIGEGNQGDGG